METLAEVFLSFDVVLLSIFVVEVGCSIFYSGKHILCVPSSFFEKIIFLESWFCLLFINAIVSFKFCPILFI